MFFVLEVMKMEILVCVLKGKFIYCVVVVERVEGDFVSVGDVFFGLDDSI